jgi:hypothetical protein
VAVSTEPCDGHRWRWNGGELAHTPTLWFCWLFLNHGDGVSVFVEGKVVSIFWAPPDEQGAGDEPGCIEPCNFDEHIRQISNNFPSKDGIDMSLMQAVHVYGSVMDTECK